MYDIIDKKREALSLTDEEINYFINGYTCGEIPDYQVSALLMAICVNGMNLTETTALAKAMYLSGDRVDLSSISGIKVDKHSTGGVGDKTTLIVGPIVAACGVPVAKMSGRGLGHTGGTIDKLDSIPGFNTSISMGEFIDNVNNIGISIVDKMGNIAPADKKLYSLRDVTATVRSMPLIASSIMSKKIASGADRILLDVKYGSGAFMRSSQEASDLAKIMCGIGNGVGKKTVALVTNMNVPLGIAIGNFNEVNECVDLLSGRNEGINDLKELCLSIASYMLWLAEKGSLDECRLMASEALESGRALNKFADFVKKQGGKWETLENGSKPYECKFNKEVFAARDGYIKSMNSEAIGMVSVILGAGRMTKESIIDYGAGISIIKKTGCMVKKGDLLAILHTSKEEVLDKANNEMLAAFTISDLEPIKMSILEEVIM